MIGFQYKLQIMIDASRTDINGTVQCNGRSEPIDIRCVLVPTLFGLFFALMLGIKCLHHCNVRDKSTCVPNQMYRLFNLAPASEPRQNYQRLAVSSDDVAVDISTSSRNSRHGPLLSVLQGIKTDNQSEEDEHHGT